MRHRTLAAAFALTVSLAFQLPDAPAADLAMSAAEFPAQTPVGLQQNILVESDVVLLSDIFFGLPPESRFAGTPIARAPRPGERIELEARWLAALAKAYGIDWSPRSLYDSTTIERASQTIAAPRIRAAILAALEAQGLETSGLRLEIDQANPRIVLASGQADSLGMGAFTYDSRSGRFFAQLVVPRDGTPIARLKVSGAAREVLQVPVLAKSMRPGEIIDYTDLDWLEVEKTQLGRNSLMDAEDLIGLSPRRPLAAGRIIHSGDLEPPVLVERNSLVTIELVTPQLHLTVQARALEDGSKGETIRVRNIHSKKVVSASVRDSGRVTINAAALTAKLQ